MQQLLTAEVGSSYLHVSATLPEALCQHGDHVLVVVQQLLHQLTEASLDILILDLSAHEDTSSLANVS